MIRSAAAAVGAGFLLAVQLAVASATTSPVVIVGAGLSGLTAGHELKKSRIDFQVFEADNRIGGRVRTEIGLFETGSLVTNRGAELVDSTNRNIRALLEEMHIGLISAKPESHIAKRSVFFGGRLIPEAEFLQNLAARYPDQFSRLKSDGERIKANAAQPRSRVHLHYDGLRAVAYLDSIGITADTDLRTFINSCVKSETGADLARADEQMSALLFFDNFQIVNGQLAFIPDHDEAFRIEGGSARLAMALYDEFPEQVSLGHRLTSVASEDGRRYTLAFETPTGPKQVKTNHLILTLPLERLRDLKMEIKGLAPEILSNLKATTYSTNTKLTFYFDSRIWNEQGHSGGLLTDRGFQVWDSSFGQPGPSGSLTLYLGEVIHPDARAAHSAQALADLELAFPGVSSHVLGKRYFTWRNSYSSSRAVVNEYTGAYRQQNPVGTLFLAGEYFGTSPGYMDSAVESGRSAAQAVIGDVRRCESLFMPKPATP
ncbi:MAG: FAD-dependent oxidoreductase [Bdellovibrionota bacterium]